MEENKQIHLWLDCDPGIDDAAAIALAIAHRDRLDICGISTVAGNQTIQRVSANAVKLTHLLGAPDIQVAQGSDSPLLRPALAAGDIHGESGLGYSNLPEVSDVSVHPNGIVAMLNGILTLPEGDRMTIAATGPMTNVGLLLKTFPEVKRCIDRIVIMGGAASGGNVTPAAEFNIWEDPEAAQILFSSGVPVVMCGLDVTKDCYLTREQIHSLARSEGTVQQEYGKMLSFYLDSPAYRAMDRAVIHDAAVILYLLEPQLFSGQMLSVSVAGGEGITRGMTVCDTRIKGLGRYAGERPNALVLDRADTEAFQQRIMAAIASFDQKDPKMAENR